VDDLEDLEEIHDGIDCNFQEGRKKDVEVQYFVGSIV
jgi:hypothetical protein